MRLRDRFFRNWPLIAMCAAALATLALLWAVRDLPIQPAPGVRIDALSAFFLLLLFGGWALAAAPGRTAWSWRAAALSAVLVAAYLATPTPVIAGAYLALALVMWLRRSDEGRPLPVGESRRSRAGAARALAERARRALLAAPGLVAAVALLVGYGALALRGAARYDARTAGAALDSFAFWFVLLACLAGVVAGAPPAGEKGWARARDIVRLAWLYPLVRLYSLGPWNTGWSFATALLGGAAALWLAVSSFAQASDGARRERARLGGLALALAGLGLGTSAGVAAGCYGLLAYLALAARGAGDAGGDPADGAAQSVPSPRRWLLSGALPFSAPFVAAWLLIGAAQGGGMILLSGAAWAATLIGALATGLATDADRNSRALTVAAATSLALGVGAPLVVLALIRPVVAQLQSGLTPYGDVNVWPWVGLEAVDSAHTQVTTLPALAVAGLMLTLSALVYLILRLRAPGASPEDGEGGAPPDLALRMRALLARLRAETPWLGWLAPGARDEERPVDGE